MRRFVRTETTFFLGTLDDIHHLMGIGSITMEQEATEVELVFRNVPKGTYAVSVRHDENVNGGSGFPGGFHAYTP